MEHQQCGRLLFGEMPGRYCGVSNDGALSENKADSAWLGSFREFFTNTENCCGG
jgi:hypothetical protein